MFSRLAILVILSACFCGVMSAAVDEGMWLDVPFVRQEKDGCGSASVAMVMQYWLNRQGRSMDKSADAIEIHRALYSPAARGVHARAMERYFQQTGFRAFTFRGEWKDLQDHLHKGRPLIVALKPSGDGAPLHYVVVAGLDSGAGIVSLNDPARRKLIKQRRSDFEKQWSGADKWTLLALPSPADQADQK